MNAHPIRRRGAAAVEVALTAPLLFLMFFAGLEFAQANMVRNIAKNAAFEGARAGILPGAVAQDSIDEANAELGKLQITGATVIVNPTVITHTTPQVTVSVTVPLSQNALPMSHFVMGKTLVQSITLAREID